MRDRTTGGRQRMFRGMIIKMLIKIHGSPGLSRTKKIFVGSLLASTVAETDFKKYFDKFGTITDVVVMYDQNAIGFITYDSEEAFDKVLVKNFHELKGKNKSSGQFPGSHLHKEKLMAN